MFHKIVIFLVINGCIYLSSSSKWHYQCTEGFCRKTLTTADATSLLSFAECNLLCLDHAGVWPMPTGGISVANLTEINIEKLSFTTNPGTNIANLVENAFHIFTSEVKDLVGCSAVLQAKNSNLPSVQINFQITDQNTKDISLEVDEIYTIETSFENNIDVTIRAETFFGARHGLETISQLVVYDDLRGRILFPANISVTDGPVYGWRGIILDTSRNYVTPKAIKRTLKAMAASKLNTFHWHLTDTASFPYVSKSHPELAEYGAYSPKKIYTAATVRDIVEYARVRGIRVVPELDAPAHVGEGWQFSGVITCFDWTPWSNYCVEPPCGQFDPSRDELYDILEDLYGDMLDQFGTNVFHMGGDEVNVACWNGTANLTNWMVTEKGWDLEEASFYTKVWPYFQINAAERLYKKAGQKVPIILWSSALTDQENLTDILAPSDYIIQVWGSGTDSRVQTLLNKTYSIILSNYDALYLDCGFAGWVTGGNNWCSPYKSWQLIYDNKPINIAGNKSNQVLGGETALWTEESGTNSLDSRLWPRSAAFAETLWAEPATDWSEAEERMLLHRDRLVSLGIDAEELQPEWCLRNQQSCPIFDSRQANIKVDPATLPTFLTSSQVFKVKDQDRVVLPCEVTNPGPYVLAWKKGIAVLSAGSVKVSPDPRVQLINGFNLEIREVGPQDAGDYVCQIGTLQPREITHTLEVLVPPQITYTSSNGRVEVKKGSSVVLECRAGGNPVPKITWSRKNNLLPGGDQTVITSVLSLDRVDRHHAGIYQCTASNGIGEDASKQIVLHVLYPPEISVENPIVHTAEGLEAHLVCIVHGENQPEVLWYRDTMQLDTTERRIMESRGSRHTLVIRKVHRTDFGNYTCVADNQLGKTRKSIQLTGKPKAATFKSSTTGNYRESYNISWEVESLSPIEEYQLLFRRMPEGFPGNDDGHPQPLHHQSQKKIGSVENRTYSAVGYSVGFGYTRSSKGHSDWRNVILPASRVSNNGVQSMSYMIRGLEPGQQYEAKVQARNKFGWSPVSKSFTFQTTDRDMALSDIRHFYEKNEASTIEDFFGIGASSFSRKMKLSISLLKISVIINIILFS